MVYSIKYYFPFFVVIIMYSQSFKGKYYLISEGQPYKGLFFFFFCFNGIMTLENKLDFGY